MQPLAVSEFEGRQDELLELLCRLVRIESPTHHKRQLDRLGSLVAHRMRRLGARTKRFSQVARGHHWLAEWGDGPGGVLMLAHMDTVHEVGTLQRAPCEQRDGRLFGPGVLDMKGGLAMALTAIKALRQAGRMPRWRVSLLCTSDEETGSLTSRPIIERLAVEHEAVFCLEPAMPDGALKTWRKGVGLFHLEVKGRAAHSGTDPSEGVNAIVEMSHLVRRLTELEDEKLGTTVNVGVIRGGSRSNVVPDQCLVTVNVRVPMEEERLRMDRELHSLRPTLPGAQVLIRGRWSRPPMQRTPAIEGAFQRAQTIACQLGMQLRQGGTGGASDANFLAPLGIPLLDGLGAVGGGAHSNREHVIVAEFPQRTALLAALLSGWWAER